MGSDNLGQQAYCVVEELAENIGPRPAGSESEQLALDYVANELQKTCQKVSRIPVKGLPTQFPTQALRLVGMIMLVYSAYWLVGAPISMLVYLVGFFVVPKLISAARKRLSASAERESMNIMGSASAGQETHGSVILCAHLDTAKANRVPGELWPKINRLLMHMWMPFVFAMAGAAGLRWLDMRTAFVRPILWQVIRAIGLAYSTCFLILELLYMYISRGDAYSPGANDNGSGVGVVLALAQHFHETPPAHLDMHYVLFTAEELGLIGSERFARDTELQKASTYVINLDMVGAGKQLCSVRGSGLIPPRFTDSGLNALCKEAHPAIKAHYYFISDSDFASFAAQGFRTASLCTKGDPQAETLYHTERDMLEYIDAGSLQMTAGAVCQVIRLLDERMEKEVASGHSPVACRPVASTAGLAGNGKAAAAN
jgi:hypothetical protein